MCDMSLYMPLPFETILSLDSVTPYYFFFTSLSLSYIKINKELERIIVNDIETEKK